MRGRAAQWIAVLAGVLIAGQAAAADAVRDDQACQVAVGWAERAAHVPPGLLTAISLVESGRTDPVTRRVAAWPWTIDVAGKGAMFETKAEAIAAVLAARASGVESIDVGCMQVNLMHHPAAFATLDEAFDPAANTRYAAAFLGQLFHGLGDWTQAVGSYHSSTPGLSDDYRTRVLAVWGVDPPAGGCVPVRRVAVAAKPAPAAGGLLQAALAQAAADQAHWSRMGWVPPAAAVDNRCQGKEGRPRSVRQASMNALNSASN